MTNGYSTVVGAQLSISAAFCFPSSGSVTFPLFWGNISNTCSKEIRAFGIDSLINIHLNLPAGRNLNEARLDCVPQDWQ